jgi:hypothetical protein
MGAQSAAPVTAAVFPQWRGKTAVFLIIEKKVLYDAFFNDCFAAAPLLLS